MTPLSVRSGAVAPGEVPTLQWARPLILRPSSPMLEEGPNAYDTSGVYRVELASLLGKHILARSSSTTGTRQATPGGIALAQSPQEETCVSSVEGRYMGGGNTMRQWRVVVFPGNYNLNTGRMSPGDPERYLERYYGGQGSWGRFGTYQNPFDVRDPFDIRK